MHPTLARVLSAVAATLALCVPALAASARTSPAAAASAGAHIAHRASDPVHVANSDGSPADHVILIGIGGLRWSDISQAATPALWRLAGQGSVGSLIVHGARQDTCPGGDWLTLNAAARAAVPLTRSGACPASPRIVAHQVPAAGAGTPAPARVPAMASLVSYNSQFSQNPQWGALAAAAGRDGCATAAGPGAAVALAGRAGQVPSYLRSASGLTRASLARCPLTVIDLGNVRPADGQGGHAARAASVSAADRQLATIDGELPARTILVVAGLSGGPTPHVQALIVRGPGYRAGLLTASSTRQPGLVVITDLTPTVLHWLGAPVPPVAVGSQVGSTGRGDLAATASMLAGQDIAAGVYRSTVAPFFLVIGFGYLVLFALIWAFPWGRAAVRRRRRRAVARAAGVWAAAVPVGTVLASLLPWWSYAHPAAVLYSLAVAWAAAVAAAALAGPWRRDPFGPVGVVATITLGVLAADVMTGSHLEPETPFGLSVLVAGRYYGLGNNAVVIYAASGALCAAWLASVARRRDRPRVALAAMAAVLAFTVIVAGWPGFGAKVGGTIAMVPGFLVLLAVAAHVRVTPRRAALIAVSGVALISGFAIANYFVPVTGHSDIGAFVGQSLHGGAGSILRRKIGSNLGSLTENPFAPVIPVVVAALGLMVFWPTRVRAHLLAHAYREIPLLRPTLSAIWLVAVLAWFAEDSGVTVPAAAFPLVLPLAVVVFSSVRPRGESHPCGAETVRPVHPPDDRPRPVGRASPNPGKSGYC